MTDSPDFEPEIVWVSWDQRDDEFFTPESDPAQLDVRIAGCDGRGRLYDPNAVLLPLHRYNELVEKAGEHDD